MLRCDSFTSQLLDSFLSPTKLGDQHLPRRTFYMEIQRYSHVTQRYHTNGLPNAQANPRCNAPVEPLQPITRVDISRRVSHGHLLRSVGIVFLALHLHADNLNRLVPCAQSTAQPTCQYLLHTPQFLAILFPCHVSDPRFRQPAQSEPTSPVRRLPNGHGIDSLVDPLDPFLAIDIHEGGPGAGRCDSLGGDLVFCYFHGFHAGAEAHSGIGLGDTTGHAAGYATNEVIRAKGFSVVFCFGGNEEEDGAFGGGLDPGPWDEALVVWSKQAR